MLASEWPSRILISVKQDRLYQVYSLTLQIASDDRGLSKVMISLAWGILCRCLAISESGASAP
jgi:hypothetical protein